MLDIEALRTRVTGPVLTPDDEGFAEEVAPWMQNFTHRPRVAVGAASPNDVAEAVKFAVANGLAVRIQSTGHGSQELIADGVLILTRRLDGISIDPTTRVATIGAGVKWGAVVAKAAQLGLAPIVGSSPTVGTIGFLLGGGLGPLARSHGFASDYVRDFEVVTADGQLISANRGTNPDLFWALRGGKGGFGVVTSVRVELVELPTLYGGSLTYDAPDIATAFRAWIDYTATADPSVSTSAAILRMPDLPFIPEPIRGRTLLTIRFAYPGDAATGERLASPLRAAAPVYLDDLDEMPAGEIARIHNDPTEPVTGWTLGRMLASADSGLATVLLDHVGNGEPAPFVAVELRHLGEATREDVAGGSAVGGRSAQFTLNLVGVPNPALFDTVLPRASEAIITALTPWLAPETTVNFVERFATQEKFEASWPPATFARLAAVRAKYDPDGVFPYGPR
ncbi:MAG: mcrA [Glaciihabitans sp.]|nr:mcrA [Glaciihabitans sp.]